MNITPHMFLTPPTEVYPPQIKEKVLFQQNFPYYNGGRGCTTKLGSCLVRNIMETYYPCTWVSFVNQEKWKNKKYF